MHESVANEMPNRRDFFQRAAAVFFGAVAAGIPMAAGVAVLLDPVRRGGPGNGLLLRVASLAALPNDGVPRKFAVSADQTDAWNKYVNVPIGAVYLRRTGPEAVTAFNAICPHAGGFIDYVGDCHCFRCPLHNSQFALDGSIQDPRSPAPRPMDSLAVEIRGDDIWVRFENFQAGLRRKIPA
jgi:menaquinol-cytochrome c reductase iron-sulfur subunit